MTRITKHLRFREGKKSTLTIMFRASTGTFYIPCLAFTATNDQQTTRQLVQFTHPRCNQLTSLQLTSKKWLEKWLTPNKWEAIQKKPSQHNILLMDISSNNTLGCGYAVHDRLSKEKMQPVFKPILCQKGWKYQLFASAPMKGYPKGVQIFKCITTKKSQLPFLMK